MKTVMLSRMRLKDTEVGAKPKVGRRQKTATQRLKTHMYRRYPARFLYATEKEREEKEFWSWIALPLKVRKGVDKTD